MEAGSVTDDGSKRQVAILGTRGIPARYGGFETFAEELATGLVRAGFPVTVFCENTHQGEHPPTYKGVQLERVPVTRLGPLTTILFDVRCLWRARRGFNVCYMLGYGAAPFLWIPRVCGTPVWVNMDGVEWKRSKWSMTGRLYLRLMERIATWTCSVVIADAEAIRTHLKARYPMMRRCTVIPYGAHILESTDPKVVAERFAIEPGEYYLVVCRLEPENHVREILAGFSDSRSKRTLLVVGDHRAGTDYVQGLQRFAGDRVRFLGTIYDSPVLAALRAHSFAYFHGHSVGGTNPSLLEAMGAGNVVIAHDNPFNREVLGESGFYFEGAAALPATMEQIENLSSAQLEERRSAVRERVRSQYSWPRIVQQYVDLLRHP